MPISQLIHKLSGKLSLEGRSSLGHRPSGPTSMDWAATAGPDDVYEVVAEVISRPASAAGSLCSLASASGRASPDAPAAAASGAQPLAVSISHQLPSPTPSHELLGASSLSGPLPSLVVGSLPATTSRALRARGKAMLRTQSGMQHAGGSCNGGLMEHAYSLDSNRSSMDIALAQLGGLQAAGAPQAAAAAPMASSPSYKRAATAPLPACSTATASGPFTAAVVQQQQHLEASGASKQPASGAAAAAVAVAAVGAAAAAACAAPSLDNEDGDDDVLVAPEEEQPHDEDAHCHWEDGVVASWLQGIDHSELLHDDDGDHEQLAAGRMPHIGHLPGSSQGMMGAGAAPGVACVFTSQLYS